jgi:hypothetical protein
MISMFCGSVFGSRAPGGVRRPCCRVVLLALAISCIATWLHADAAARRVPLASAVGALAPRPAPVEYVIALPDVLDIGLRADDPARWLQADALAYAIVWPATAPSNAQTLVFLIDRDDRWYQSVPDARLRPGTTNYFAVTLAAGQPSWQPVGHTAAWHYRSRLNPKAVGIRVFGDAPFNGACVLASAELSQPATPPAPPVIANVRMSTREPACYDLLEISFDLPDRYANPFDPDEIDVQARFTTTNGVETLVGGFYYQDHYRLKDAVGEQILPQRRPEWRVRFTPTAPGPYRFSLRARDRAGETRVEGDPFVARPAAAAEAGFVRVAKSDPRFFETDDRRFFFPVGHNVRSPFDARMDKQFPWRFRHPEGSSAYTRYFRDMQAAGENLAEVWTCAWSMGLEWSATIPGYHGAGDYRMDSAWELDRVFEWARRHNLRVNFVLNNHGRVSTWCDAEWQDHPYNQAQGGWLSTASEFFSDERAVAMQKRLSRYLVDRYGWDRTIFAWELMSELDLVGDNGSRTMHHDPRVHEWHRKLASFIRARDPWRHLVATHIATDYTLQDETLARMPELDHNAVDAYHHGRPDRIVDLLQETAAHNAPYGRPTFVTEFGGSPMAAGIVQLKLELHAALWTSTASTLAGTPLFWWWHVIEEENLYPEYRAIARFMDGVDKRDPELKPTTVAVVVANPGGRAQPEVEVVCVASPNRAIGWVWSRSGFQAQSREDTIEVAAEKTEIRNVAVEVAGFGDRVYRIEICDTANGLAVKRLDLRPQDGRLRFEIPPFQRDVAFKIAAVAK